MKNISIDKQSCILCQKCVKICPSGIFQYHTEAIEVTNRENCIVCGHCVAVCPTSAVNHSEFPEEKIHAANRKLLPSPEQIMLLCKLRRSNRANSQKPIPGEYLELILEAAHRAPTASNLQQVEFTLVTDPEKLKKIGDMTMGTLASMIKPLNNILLKSILKKAKPNIYRLAVRLKELQKEHQEGNDPILRKSTALIFIHTPEKSRFGCQDSNLAYQNGSLMAESLGINHFYTGFVCTAAKKNKNIANLLNIKGSIHAGMALALPEFKFEKYIDKKDIQCRYFE